VSLPQSWAQSLTQTTYCGFPGLRSCVVTARTWSHQDCQNQCRKVGSVRPKNRIRAEDRLLPVRILCSGRPATIGYRARGAEIIGGVAMFLSPRCVRDSDLPSPRIWPRPIHHHRRASQRVCDQNLVHMGLGPRCATCPRKLTATLSIGVLCPPLNGLIKTVASQCRFAYGICALLAI